MSRVEMDALAGTAADINVSSLMPTWTTGFGMAVIGRLLEAQVSGGIISQVYIPAFTGSSVQPVLSQPPATWIHDRYTADRNGGRRCLLRRHWR
jgi:hypothetical protein